LFTLADEFVEALKGGGQITNRPRALVMATLFYEPSTTHAAQL